MSIETASRDGTVILAGRTRSRDASTFGVVIFKAPDAKAALDLMRAGRAVRSNTMTAELSPFLVALGRTSP